MPFPSPDTRTPVVLPDGTPHPGTVFLQAAIDHPRWRVGRYAYASAHVPPADWAAHLAPFLHAHAAERLEIGAFAQIADGALFVTSAANHRHDGISTFPFAIFDGMDPARPSLPGPETARDTVVGPDVWIGTRAIVLPGARIGAGCILGAGAVVGGTVPPYSVVAGNPGRVVRRRFDDATVARLMEVAWWDWPIEAILEAEAAICGGDVAALERAAP